eukprot:Hpha_TRINITY_DN17152_c0_g1::TRINITY_DN17152_c0_g1_i1::g.146868::m.146868
MVPSVQTAKWLGRLGVRGRAVSLHRTACIVTCPPAKDAALVVPGNEALVGARAGYFERGADGPPPEPVGGWAASSKWCGMEAGPLMLYPVQCVDGMVDQLGGGALRASLEGQSCTVGGAIPVQPPGGSALCASFALLVYTAPPVWPRGAADEAEWMALLTSCHTRSYEVVQGAALCGPVVVPLLGAGARGAPEARAATAAADAAAVWLAEPETVAGPTEIMFCVNSDSAFAALERALSHSLSPLS